MSDKTSQAEFFSLLDAPFTCEALFDHLTDVVYFVKNDKGEYVVVNQTLVERCGLSNKHELIGKTTDQVHPYELGAEYKKQDDQILQDGTPIINQLELHLTPTQELCWCITTKVALRGKEGKIIGLAGVSRDIPSPAKKHEEYKNIAETVSYIKQNYNKQLLVDDLANMAGMSAYQYEQRMQKIFKLTAGQFIQKTRIEMALWKLQDTDSQIVEIALDCGYADQSAFTRQFKKTIGVTPAQYRKIMRHKSFGE